MTDTNTCDRASATPGPRPFPPRGDLRLLFMLDLSSHAREPHVTDPATPEQIHRLVDDVALSGADVFGQEVFGQGWVLHFRSDTYEYDQRPQHRRWIPMLDQGINPIEVFCERAHQRGMKFIAGARFGDDHGAPIQAARWFHDHPQYKLTEMPPSPLNKPGNTLDFSFAEVRDYHFGAIEEIARRFDIDGIEITFRSYNHFPFPRPISRQRQPLMTELIGRIRRMLDERGQQLGRKLLLGVRVPETVDECHDCGLDIPTWIADDLISYVSPSEAMYANHNAQWEEFFELTRGTQCRLFPGILPFCSASDARSDTTPWGLNGKPSGTEEHISWQSRIYLRPMEAQNYRAIARNMYGSGADGISIFNFQEHYTGNLIGNYPGQLAMLAQLREPDRLAAAPRVYLFRSMLGDVDYHGAPGMAATGAIKDDRMVLTRSEPGQRQEYRLRLCEQLDAVAHAYLVIRAQDLQPHEQVEIDLNGSRVPTAAVRKIWHPHGRSVNQGRPLPPYSSLFFDLTPDTAVYGDNLLGMRLVEADAASAGEILIDEIDVSVVPGAPQRGRPD